jgi:hypothetical protein
VRLVRESTHPVAQVARNLVTPNNMLYRWTSQHRQAEVHGTTRAYELYVERGCRGCVCCPISRWRKVRRCSWKRERPVQWMGPPCARRHSLRLPNVR